MKNKIYLMTFLAGLFLLSSCLKDDKSDYWKDDVAGKMYATVSVPTLQSLGLQPVEGEVEFSFAVNIATDALPTKDITLTFAVDADACTAYNTRTGKNYLVYPNVEILTPSVTIAKGTRTGTVRCKVWGAEALNACDNYMAPISIKTVTDNIPVAANMKTYMLALPIANPYQGTYHSTGTFKHPTAGTRNIDEIKTLSTVDCRTVLTTVGDLGGYEAYFTVNDDNTVTVTGGLSDSQPLVQSGVNTYDPATKTFTINYYYVGSGGNRVISETLVRQ